MLDESSSVVTQQPADFDDAFGQSADLVTYHSTDSERTWQEGPLPSGGHPDEATALLADPAPLGYWPDEEVNAALAEIEDERTVAAAGKIAAALAVAFRERFIAALPAGCRVRLTNEVCFGTMEDGPQGRLTPYTTVSYYMIAFPPHSAAFTVAYGRGDSWQQAFDAAMADYAQTKSKMLAAVETFKGTAA